MLGRFTKVVFFRYTLGRGIALYYEAAALRYTLSTIYAFWAAHPDLAPAYLDHCAFVRAYFSGGRLDPAYAFSKRA